jgi:hypothetical protein
MRALVDARNRKLAALGPRDVSIGVHLRQGDKKTESTVFSPKAYAVVADEVAAAYLEGGVRARVFVSSDNDAVFEDFNKQSRSIVNFAEGEVRGLSSATDNALKIHKFNVTQYAVEVPPPPSPPPFCNFVGYL